MFDELVSQIVSLMGKKLVVVVAISGFGGSGKSTLTDKFRDHFGLRDAQIVRIDSLYSETPNGPHILDQVDWPLLKQILTDVHAGKNLNYMGRDDNGRPVPIDEKLPELVIVEGIRLLQPSLMPYFDLAVWIDCPHEVAVERAKARDRSQCESEKRVAQWDWDWGLKDKLYFETFQPDKLATFIYRGY